MKNKLYRVIRTDNYSRSGEQPGYDEIFITVPLPSGVCNSICEFLNSEEEFYKSNAYYFCVVDENYKLNVFEA